MNGPAPCEHRVQYYETDQMGIVHHSNYIRWFEEARDHLVRQYGVDYQRIEEAGVLMPVVNVACDYKSAAEYGDVAEIRAVPAFFNGVRLRYEYEIRLKGSGVLVAVGRSEHCFIDAETRKPLNLRRRLPAYAQALTQLAFAAKEGEG